MVMGLFTQAFAIDSGAAAGAVTYHVAASSSGGSDNTGTGSVEHPFMTISHAIEAAGAAGETDLIIALDSNIEITKTLTFSGNVPNITIQGNNFSIIYRGDEDLGTGTAAIVVTGGSSVRFENMALTRQNGLAYKGGILYVQDADVTLSLVKIYNGLLSVSDVADGGSAIHVASGGYAKLENNTKIYNNATNGSNTSGAIFVGNGGELEVTGAIIEKNEETTYGTGVYVQAGGSAQFYSNGDAITISDEVYVEVGADAKIGAANGMSGNINLNRVFLESENTASAGIATLDIIGETRNAVIGIEVHNNYHYAYRLISNEANGYSINDIAGHKDETGWSDLDGLWDIRYMVYDGVPGLYSYYFTVNTTFHGVDTLTGIGGTDINGNEVSYYNPEDIQNSTVSGGILTVPEITPVNGGDYTITFSVDEENKDYRIPTPDQVQITLGNVILINGQDYDYVPDYENGTATITVHSEALKDATGTLDFNISGEKYSLLTLQMNGPLYTMSTDITGQQVTKALSIVEDVTNKGSDISYEITRDGYAVPGVTVVLYQEGTNTEVNTGITDESGKVEFSGLNKSYSYYYVLYYSDSFHVIARDKVSLALSTLEGQKMASRCDFDENSVSATYSAADAANYSTATSVVTGTIADTRVTYYVDLAQDVITFDANQGEATTADTATFIYNGESYREDSFSKNMETNAATYGNLPDITMVGYIFDGWYTAAEGGELITSDVIYDTVSSAKILYAHWTPGDDIKYDIQHWVEYVTEGVNPGYVRDVTETKVVNGVTYYLWSTDNYADGTADSTMDDVMHLALKSMNPADYSWWTLDGFTITAEQNCKILADGSSVFGCYYDRNEYTITFDPTEGSMKGDANTMLGKFGANIGSMLVAVRDGYRFGGWYYALNESAEVVVTSTSWYTWTNDITVSAKWTNSDTTYIIKIMTEDKSYNEKGLAYADGTYTQFKTVKQDNYGQPLAGFSDVEMTVDISSISSLSFEGFTYIGYNLTGNENGEGMVSSENSFTFAPNEFGTTIVYLYYSRNQVQVTFRDDAADRDPGVHENVTIVYGDIFENALPEVPPTKPGYDFTGWVDADGNPVDAETSTNIYTGEGNGTMDLFPVWEARVYYITYVPGESVVLDSSELGVGYTINSEVSGGYTVAQPITYDEAMGTMPTVNKPGYVFLGWMLKDGPSAGSYVTDATIADVNSVITKNSANSFEDTYVLYAMYEPFRFTLEFDPGNGTVEPKSMEVIYDAELPELPTPVLTGYTFTGWMLDTDIPGGTRIESSDIWTYLTTNGAKVVAHAGWIANRYAYDLNLNDVTYGNGSTTASLYDTAISGVEIPFDSEYATALDGVVAQRNGYYFLGWSLSTDKKDLLNSAAVNKLPEDATLYAIWQPIVYQMKVTLNNGVIPQDEWFNFNDYASTYYTSYATNYGCDKLVATYDSETDTWTVPVIFDTIYGEIGELTRENYKFEGYRVSAPGWYDGDSRVKDGDMITVLDVAYTDSVDSGIALNAVWTPYFDFVLVNDEARFDDGVTGYKHILKTDLLTNGLPVAVRDDYTFLGWYDDISGQYIDMFFIQTLDEYRSFRAVFTPNVTFDANGGKVIVDDVAYDEYVIGLSTLIEKYGKFFNAVLDGRTFMGWYSEDTSDLTVFENIINRATPITLTAKWNVTITFHLPEGAYWDDGSTDDKVYPARDVGDWSNLPTAYLNGYTFVEWHDDDDAPVTPAGLAASDVSIVVHPLFQPDNGNNDRENINVTVTNYAPGQIGYTSPVNGWVAGTNTFAVASGAACNAGLVRNGELTELAGTTTNGTSYAFTADLQDGDEIILVLVGDVNLDGQISIADFVCLNQHIGGEYDLSLAAALAADINHDGGVSIADFVCLNQYIAGEYTMTWNQE